MHHVYEISLNVKKAKMLRKLCLFNLICMFTDIWLIYLADWTKDQVSQSQDEVVVVFFSGKIKINDDFSENIGKQI